MNAVVAQNNTQLSRQDTIKSCLMGSKRQIESLLQDKDKANRFLAASLVVASDSTLSKCTPDSIAQALIGVAMSDLNIDKNVGHCYLVPYGFGEQRTAQLQIGYKGFIQLLFRAGWMVKCFPVYHCDRFSMEFDGWDNKVDFIPNIDDRDEGDKKWVFDNLRGIFVVARHSDTKDEYSTFVGKAVIEKLRLNSPNQKASQFSKPADREKLEQGLPIGIWADWYIEMAQAKAVKKLAKILPIGDSRTTTAIAADDKTESGKFVDYSKTSESGVVIDFEEPKQKPKSTTIDEIIESEYIVDNGTGEIIEPDPINSNDQKTIADPYAELKAQIAACKTKSEISRLYAPMKEPMKSDLKEFFKRRQDEINAGA